LVVLNGWRRLGIVLVALWVILVVGTTVTELATSTSLLFSYQGIPVGTRVVGDKVTLPDGKVISIRVPVDLIAGEFAKPWEIDWSHYPEIPKTTVVRWGRVSIAAAAVPIVFCLIAEILVAAVAWVRRGGFRDEGRHF
jgi:hypothetical protein